MALDALLENEARAEIERLRAEGQARAREIVEGANARAQTLIENRERSLEAQRAAALNRARSAAELEMSAARLNAGESGLKRAFELAEGQLRDVVKAPEYREILSRLIKEARGALENVEVLEVNPADVAVARQIAPDVEVRGNPAISGGVRAVAGGGKSGITNTLPGRLERVRGTLAPQIAKLLAE